ncbi:MAG: phosphoribosylamine--glycine ligase [Anaerolineae bacterium]|nr:phosphoribosylamine--glycine ligase [Anaerolineae bacterium]
MRTLVIGSGGREHALAWKLLLSPQVSEVFVTPGNSGTGRLAQNVDVNVTDIPALVAFAKAHAVDLTVVGPEAPLVAGIVDAFQAAGLRAFGPSAAAARLEGSKAFAKEFMVQEGIPTAEARIFDDYKAARAALIDHRGPIVVKASGLAAGKGVLLCDTRAEAERALHQIMVARVFGDAGDRVLLEERLEGEEASLLAFSDGQTVVPMLPARDYKRALDGDQGLNTGGMGGYAPSPYLDAETVEVLTAQVLQPTIDGMRRRGTPYVGVLYAGLMLTGKGPRVLEFNARFGDPEAQILLPLLRSDLVNVMLACIEGRLTASDVTWRDGYSVGVVLASGGYPASYEKGKPISGLAEAGEIADAIFHAGTRREDDEVVTAGGRVLAVTATAATLHDARHRAYEAVGKIRFNKMHYRTDIATPQPAAQVPVAMAERSVPSNSGAGAPDVPAPAARSAYAAAGVDIDAGEQAVALMKKAVQATYTPEVLGGIGAFGGSLSIGALSRAHDLVLVATTDGVGTKTMIAEAMGIYNTVGHDIVNHCVNDILVQGARPLIFLDYIAAAELDPVQIATVVGGCAAACEAVGCVLIGGETAEMPGVYRPGAFDLVGTMIGWVDRGALIDGQAVHPGDVCLGIPSSGLHTNGFSLARHALADIGWETLVPELGRSLGEALLAPHRPYLREVEALWDAGVTVKAMSHLTGGAYIENLPRVLPEGVGARIDRAAWEVPFIFRLIQKRGQVADREMYRVYNMGMGMVVFLAPQDVDAARRALPEAVVIGEATAWDGQAPRVMI